jgi:hypothetical protein
MGRLAPGRDPGQSGRLAHDGRAQPDAGPAAPRGPATDPGTGRRPAGVDRPGRGRQPGLRARTARRRAARRRRAPSRLPVLPSRAGPGGPDRADPARGRRPDHVGDRSSLPGPRDDDVPTSPAGQTQDRPSGNTVPDARARRAARSTDGSPARHLSGLHRRLERNRNRRCRARRSVRGGRSPRPARPPTAAGRTRGSRVARAHAPARLPASSQGGPVRRAGAARGAGPAAVEPSADRRGSGTDLRNPGERAGRAVPGAGRDRRSPRRSRDTRADRLDRDPGAVRPSGAARAVPAGDPEPRGRRRGGRRSDAGPASRRPARGVGRPSWNHRLLATRAHLLVRLGRTSEAADAFRRAADVSPSAAERRYLASRAETLACGAAVDPARAGAPAVSGGRPRSGASSPSNARSSPEP